MTTREGGGANDVKTTDDHEGSDNDYVLKVLITNNNRTLYRPFNKHNVYSNVSPYIRTGTDKRVK